MTSEQTERIIDAVVKDLFATGEGDTAELLVLRARDQPFLGSWDARAVREHLRVILSRDEAK